MNALLIRPCEKIEETNIDFTPVFFKDYFGDVTTGCYCITYLNINIYFLLEPVDEPINIKLFDMTFYGNVLITGAKPDGEPCSIEANDAAFIKRYIKSYTKPQKRVRIKEVSICDY